MTSRNSQIQAESARALQAEIDALHTHWETVIRELATKFKKKPEYIRKLVYALPNLKKRRAPNLKNALLHRKAKETNEGRADGERLGLVEIQKEMDLDAIMKDLTEEQKEELVQELRDYRELKETGSHSSNVAAA
ncbi:hypothetical protein AX17_003094 [Amanita inopinata Kibby_2008]|nr:hypothetical protein AX17_003094 [Amanita inopinata Kibby_2008]